MNRLLLVIDYQNDFVSGTLGFPAARALEDGILAKIQTYRQRGDAIIFTFDTHGANYLASQEGVYLPISHCIEATEGWQLYGKVAGQQGHAAACFSKNTFGSLELANYLRTQDFDEIELVGLVSHICVLSNAVLAKAALPEAKIIIDAALTASGDPLLHEKGLDVMAGLQMDIRNRQEAQA